MYPSATDCKGKGQSTENIDNDSEKDDDQKSFLGSDEEGEDVYLEEFMVVLDDSILKNKNSIDCFKMENKTGQTVSGRAKRTKEMNKAVPECYFRSQKTDKKGIPFRGCRQRLFKAWYEVGLLESTKQRLCDQARLL